MLRDGTVHHESATIASAHARTTSGDHGHEDGASSGETGHGADHEHGTSSDHCTHSHSVALIASLPTLPEYSVAETHITESAFPRELVSEGFLHPPQG